MWSCFWPSHVSSLPLVIHNISQFPLADLFLLFLILIRLTLSLSSPPVFFYVSRPGPPHSRPPSRWQVINEHAAVGGRSFGCMDFQWGSWGERWRNGSRDGVQGHGGLLKHATQYKMYPSECVFARNVQPQCGVGRSVVVHLAEVTLL